MEDMVRMFRTQLFSAFYDWVETNKQTIGDKWYGWFLKEGKKAEDECTNAIKIMGTSMWMFNMVANWVWTGLGPNHVGEIQYLAEGIDEKSTMRLLHLMAACLSLQYLPKEIATKEMPIISGKHFSLKLFTQTH